MPYLNSEVFYRTLPAEACDLVTLPPRAMAAAVEAGELDGGPLPVAEIFRLGDMVRQVADLGVTARGRAQSVLIFSDRPVRELDGRDISVTADTATSIQLIRVLAADRWGISPRYVGPDAPASAQLLIGDDAIRRRESGDYAHVIDLGHEWHDLTGLPFVFALWVVHADVSSDAAGQFETALWNAYCDGRQMVKEIAADRATAYFSPKEASDYIRHFTYIIGDSERRGMEEFNKRLEKLPEWRPAVVEPVAGPSRT